MVSCTDVILESPRMVMVVLMQTRDVIAQRASACTCQEPRPQLHLIHRSFGPHTSDCQQRAETPICSSYVLSATMLISGIDDILAQASLTQITCYSFATFALAVNTLQLLI